MSQPMKIAFWEKWFKISNPSFKPIQNSVLEQIKSRTWDQTNLVLNSIEKVKPVFSLSLMCMFPESIEENFWSHSLHLQNSGIFQTGIDERRSPQKWIFAILV